jgi:hypothetical protein
MIWLKILATSFVIAVGLTLKKDKEIALLNEEIVDLKSEIFALQLTIAYYENNKTI